MKPEDFIHMPIPASMFTAVCALLGAGAGRITSVDRSGNLTTGIVPGNEPSKPLPATTTTEQSSAGAETIVQENQGSAGTGQSVTTVASPSDGEVDAHGHPWNADLHASTKGKTKDGLWRMKTGVQRPEPLPGFPIDASQATGTSSATEAGSATSQVATGQETVQSATEEDDEFAAFREAAAKSEKQDEAAKASVPARKFSDADLGQLCNQAAVKLGDPSPIKEIIAKFVPEGQVAHSRNIPEERREEFAQAVEQQAGIEFAG